jgi:CBS domain-containing protein
MRLADARHNKIREEKTVMKNITVSELMTPNAVLISPEATLAEAARRMREADCGFLPVGSNGNLLGIITDRDIVIRAIAESKNPLVEKVRTYMTPHVYACNERDYLEDAADKMHEHKVTRLVVRNGKGHVSGVLSFGGILRNGATSKEMSDAVKHTFNPEAA